MDRRSSSLATQTVAEIRTMAPRIVVPFQFPVGNHGVARTHHCPLSSSMVQILETPLLQHAKELLLNNIPEQHLSWIRKIHYANSVRKTSLEDLMDGSTLERLIDVGDAVADIGASVGYYSKAFSDVVGPRGHVYSVEPLPINFETIRFCLLLWGVSNVELTNAALSDEVGTTSFTLPSYGVGGAKVYEGKLTCECREDDDPGQCIEVATTTLDELLGYGYRNVDVVKLDAMCHELSCIKGAGETIERRRPAWLIAVYSDPNVPESDAKKLFDLMTETHGYKVLWEDPDKCTLRHFQAGENTYRFFFLDDDHIEKLCSRGVVIDG
jgi:FkbM family methyltransferase